MGACITIEHMSIKLDAIYYQALNALDRLSYYAHAAKREDILELVAKLTTVVGTAFADRDPLTLEEVELQSLSLGDKLERELGIIPPDLD